MAKKRETIKKSGKKTGSCIQAKTPGYVRK